MPPAPQKPPSWFHSKAKKIMTQDMIDGLVPVKEKIKNYKQLYESFYGDHEEFRDFPWHDVNVPSRIKRLQATIANLGDSWKKDEAAMKHDKILHPKPTHGYNGLLLWAGSKADQSLREDLEANKHLELPSAELFASRPEYKDFGQTRFVKRIDQLKEAAKEFGKTPGQNRSTTGKLPRGCPEESRKGKLEPWKNSY